jgi:hypothetical protein
MEQNAGSFLAVRRLSGGAIHHHRHHSSPGTRVAPSFGYAVCLRAEAYGYGFFAFLFRAPAAEVVGVSTAWLGKGLSCVCAQRRESDARLSFDLSPIQVKARSDYVLLLLISL